MDKQAEGWVKGVAFDVHHTEGSRHPVLTRRHKLELLSIVAGGIGSTVFFTIPLLLLTTPAAYAPLDVEPASILAVESAVQSLPGVPVDVDVPAPARARRALVPARTTLPRQQRTSVHAEAPIAHVRARHDLVPVARLAVTSRQTSAAYRGAPPRPVSAPPKDLVRLVIGDGRYRVQPFPTVGGKD